MKLTRFLLLLIVAAFAVAAAESGGAEKEDDEDDEGDEGEEEEGEDEEDDAVTLTEDHIRKLHKAIDLNGDGKTSREEFTQYAKDQYLAMELKYFEQDQKDPKTAEKTKSINDLLDDLKKEDEIDDPEAERASLVAADENKDGFIDAQEYFHYYHASTDAVLEVDAQNKMKKVDLNQDGSIDFDEFQKQEDDDDEKESPTMEESKEVAALFNSLDRDGNGFLNLDEWKPYSAPYHGDQDETIRLIEVADTNKDGHLELDELIKSGILDEFDEREHAEGSRGLFQAWVGHHSESDL